MATLNIGGQTVNVDDAFLKLSPAEQQSAVEEISSSLKPDKYKQAAIDFRDQERSAGIDTNPGYARQVLQGMTMGGADEVLAGLRTPIEMVKHGTFDPTEGYAYAKAKENLGLEEARQKNGMLGTAAEIGGGVLTGGTLARGGATLVRAGQGILPRMGAMAAEGAAYGGVNGALEGEGVEGRLGGAAKGAAIGGAIGGALPVVGRAVGTVAAPFISNIRARINPAGVAESQVGRALTESGQTPQQVSDAVAQAAQEGQPYTVADALGNPGQRILSGVSRSPGEGRTAAVDFLENRQAGQSRRIVNMLAEGLDAPTTADQTRTALTAARNAAADQQYGQVRTDAAPVDLSRTIANIDETLRPGVNSVVNPGSNLANDTAEQALANVRSRLANGREQLTDFTAVQRVRGDLADQIQAADRAGAGNKARLLRSTLREMDAAMEAASAGHREANANFSNASRTIDAIDAGRTAAMRGRPENTIPAYQALTPEAQAAYRTGYADPLIEQTQNAAVGVNKARPLLADGPQAEMQAIAPQGQRDMLARRLARENTMFETRAHATGGSRTADNLGDQSALHVDPSIVHALMRGDIIGAGGHALRSGSNALTGNTPAVRSEIARLLLARGNDPGITDLANRLATSNSQRQAIVAALSQGINAGTGNRAGQRR